MPKVAWERNIQAAKTIMPTNYPNPSSGFTLVEFIVTIIVIGILSAVVLTNLNTVAQHSVITQADEFRRNLSHIQLMAISQGQRLRLSVNAGGTSYSVVSCNTSACTATSAVTDPATGQNPFSVTLTDGVTIAPTSSTLDFDSLGRPQSGGSLITGTKTYTLSGSGQSAFVGVLPITGFAS